MHNDITDIPGIRVGHDTNLEAGTGCTVILCDTPAVGGVDVRGGAPATRETDLLHPLHMVEEVHAIILTGGSAFGLDAAGGVMRYLEEHSIGIDVGVAKVPIVPAAAILDFGFGSASVRSDTAVEYRAKGATNQLAQMAHYGIAQVIRPAHTMFDGDTVFALALGTASQPKEAATTASQVSMIGATAAATLARAILNAVRNARALHG